MEKTLFDLESKVVLVTGGAGLIGSRFIEAIASSGATAIIADISREAMGSALSKLKTNNTGNIDSVVMDITSEESIKEAMNEVISKYGRIDGIVNNAYPRNKNYGRKFFEVGYNDFCENLNMHLGGYFLCNQKFSEYFKDNSGGVIVNISSIYGVVAPEFSIYDGTTMTVPVEYAAIKSSLIHLTKYIAKYLKGTNVRVNSLSLGGLLDGQPESFLVNYKDLCINKGMLDTDDVTGTLLFLLSDSSRYINGQNIVVDDGFSI